MMDPLSIAASVAGLLRAAGQIYTILETLSAVKDSPATIRDAQTEVKHTERALTSLQEYLQHLDLVDPQRAALIQVDELRVTLGDAMLVFSEFESYLSRLSGMNRARLSMVWARQLTMVDEYRAKIQRYASSLNLMLTIIQCKSQLEALQSQRSLQILVEDVLLQNQTLKRLLMQSDETSGNGFAFETTLLQSWVYRRNEHNECDASFVSSVQNRSHAWSVFSGYSLADISVLSVVAMPLTLREIANCQHYEAAGNAPSKPGMATVPASDNSSPRDQEQHLQPLQLLSGDDPDDRIHETDHVDEGEDDGDILSRISSSPSIDDEWDIHDELVYAIHSFVSTVEGQANVTKGGALVLLDDSNSYWWLVKVVQDGSIGYIPADRIETPIERLARLNKHRNMVLGGSLPTDFAAWAIARSHARKTIRFNDSPEYIPREGDGSDSGPDDQGAVSVVTILQSSTPRSTSPVEPPTIEMVDVGLPEPRRNKTSAPVGDVAEASPKRLDMRPAPLAARQIRDGDDGTDTRMMTLTPDWLRGGMIRTGTPALLDTVEQDQVPIARRRGTGVSIIRKLLSRSSESRLGKERLLESR